MMKKREIIACLKANEKISDYELSIVQKDSRELFYVLDHLEINRAVKIEDITVKVYVSDQKKTGVSTVIVTAADDEKSLNVKLKKAVTKAKAAGNEYYPLPEKTVNLKTKPSAKRDLNMIAVKAAKAVFKADHYRNGWINSTEIFVSELHREFLNSKGIDHQSEEFRIEIECIPTWSNKKEEYELYKFYESGKIDYRKITEEIDEILNMAKARSKALTLKDIELPKDLKVLVKGDMRDEIVWNLASDLSYANVYMKQNHYQKGDVLSENPFDLTMRAQVAGCSRSRRFDDHGVVLSSRKLIDKGIVRNSYGDIRFGYYLKEKKISGRLPVCVVKGEGTPYRKGPHLVIENFSAPQLESDSGYWGGEVRLARYFDGKKYIPLTGFSIAGEIYEDLKHVEFSKEQDSSPSYQGPKYLIFKGVKIS